MQHLLSPATRPNPAPLHAWQQATVQRLGEADRRAVREHLLALPASERASRFGSAVNDEWIATWVACLDFRREAVCGLALHGVLIGVAHVASAHHCGVSVLAPWRGKGIARALLTAAWWQHLNYGLGNARQ